MTRLEMKQNFSSTSLKKKTTNTKITRTLQCKTVGCAKIGMIVMIGKSSELCELHHSQDPHKDECETDIEPFKDLNLRKLFTENITPKQIISRYNQNAAKKLPNNDEMRRKISQLRYVEKQKATLFKGIKNLKDLKDWLNERYEANLSHESFQNLGWDEPFIAYFEIYQENFFALVTTKNLIYNLIKQTSRTCTQISADGTYKLNKLGYPTIVLGTVDLHKKFHLSKIDFHYFIYEF